MTVTVLDPRLARVTKDDIKRFMVTARVPPGELTAAGSKFALVRLADNMDLDLEPIFDEKVTPAPPRCLGIMEAKHCAILLGVLSYFVVFGVGAYYGAAKLAVPPPCECAEGSAVPMPPKTFNEEATDAMKRGFQSAWGLTVALGNSVTEKAAHGMERGAPARATPAAAPLIARHAALSCAVRRPLCPVPCALSPVRCAPPTSQLPAFSATAPPLAPCAVRPVMDSSFHVLLDVFKISEEMLIGIFVRCRGSNPGPCQHSRQRTRL